MLMATVALVWLAYQFWRLLWQETPIWPTSPTGAVDLKILHEEVHDWFAGRAVYGRPANAVYLPATYVLLWPLLGWLPVTAARWLWGVTTVAALGWLVRLIVRGSGADTPLERAFVALMPLSMYAAGAAIGNGQLIVHVLPLLLAGVLLLRQSQGRWRDVSLPTFLLLLSLAKPTLTVPFFWIVLFAPGGLRSTFLAALGYVGLTLFAASFQEPEWPSLWREWLAGSSKLAAHAGTANVHVWLGALGLERWMLPASLLLLLTLGLWTYRHRRADLWLLMGVAAIIARFWTHHRWYDDLLILLPMVALFRIARRGPGADRSDVLAGVLLGLTLLTTLAPGGLYLFPWPWNRVYVAGQVVVWVAVLFFLLDRARRG